MMLLQEQILIEHLINILNLYTREDEHTSICKLYYYLRGLGYYVHKIMIIKLCKHMYMYKYVNILIYLIVDS